MTVCAVETVPMSLMAAAAWTPLRTGTPARELQLILRRVADPEEWLRATS